MNLSPRTLIAASVALALLVCTLAIALALRAPVTGLVLAPLDGSPDGLRVVEVRGPGGAGLVSGDVIVAFRAGDARIPATADLLVEDPDGIPTWEGYRALMANQSALHAALAAGPVTVETAGGRTAEVTARERHAGDLPFLFWLQLAFGVGGMVTGALVLAGRPGDTATRLYALTGLGFLVFAPAAAVYSTRELVFDGELFRLLSLTNHFGAMLFTVSLTSLLWVYPVRLRGFPVVPVTYLAGAAAFVLDALQMAPDNTFSPSTVLLIFSLSFVFAGMQWWKTRRAPAERAALRWFLLSIYLATGLFAGVILIPTALGVPPPASQGVMFGAFLIMYWGLALGVIRYRLFRLDEWWRAIWWWFLGGVAVVLLDVLLLSLLAIPEGVALSLAVAIVGWLYFPVRQWAWERLGRRRERTVADWLPDVLPIIIDTRPAPSQENQMRDRWPAVLQSVFNPLSLETADGPLAEAEVRENGLALAAPDLRDPSRHLVLRHADGGARLFSRNDARTLGSLNELLQLALDRLGARDAGARVERERIRRDIHDDLGARLLSLLHTSAPEQQPLVREALEDLRGLVRAMELDSTSLREAADGWQAEARRRCEAAGVSLAWRGGEIPAQLLLNARQHANLTRVLREAVSNALRHAAPTAMIVTVNVVDDRLQLEVDNDGRTPDPANWPLGRGRQIMRNRIGELAGNLDWKVDDGLCRVVVSVPLAAPAA